MTLSHLKHQTARLVSMYGYEPEAAREIMDYLSRFCVNDQHVTAVVDSLLETCRTKPLPSDISLVAHECRPEMPRGYCGACNGTGWLHKTVGVYECSYPCSCRGAA